MKHCNNSFTSGSPAQTYNKLVKSYALKPDENQAIVVEKLDLLYHELQHYKPPKLPSKPDTKSSEFMGTFQIYGKSTSSKTKKSKLFTLSELYSNAFKLIWKDWKPSNMFSAPNGLYIYGTAGTGKTMLMDIFYDGITNLNKRRVHFNKFMLEIHDAMHEYTQNLRDCGLSVNEICDSDPLPFISLSIAKKATVLCLDEFQVTDILDAILLNRLFTSLFRNYGVICIATSNRSPDNLYKNGLQREAIFMPFLKLFTSKMDIIDLNSMDYRVHGGIEINKNVFEGDWNRLLIDGDGNEYKKEIHVMAGRKFLCPRCIKNSKTNSKATRFTFNELCAKNVGVADYLALSEHFAIIFIENIPYFDLENRNEMKRFILLIDELYNNKCRIVCLSADSPDKLLNIHESDLKNVFEDFFQFDRCSSRLMEMQSIQYLDYSNNYWANNHHHHQHMHIY